MISDVDFNNFISTSLTLEKKVTSEYSPSLVINDKRTQRKIFTEEELTELKSINDFESLNKFLKAHKIENVEQKITDLKLQSLSFYNFVSKYPKFRNLTKQEKTMLIHNLFKAKDNFKTLVSFNYNHSQNNECRPSANVWTTQLKHFI